MGRKIEEKIDGLIFWHLDNDELAIEVGKKLENNPPEGIKVIEYTGERDSPGFCKEAEKYTYVEDAIAAIIKKYGYEGYKQLLDMDAASVKPIDDWTKKLIKEYQAKFSMELHDTQTKRDGKYQKRKDGIDMQFLVTSFNTKLYYLLDNYCKATRPILANKYNIDYFYASLRFLHTNPYHQIIVEIDHNPLRVDKTRAIDDACNLVIELSQYLREQYPKLWKRYM